LASWGIRLQLNLKKNSKIEIKMRPFNNQQIKSNMIYNKTRKFLTYANSLVLSLVFFTCIFTSTQAQTNSKVKQSDSFSFAFITDIHIDYKGNTLQYFDKAVDKINKLNPDFIVTGGDNIYDATHPSESHADSLYNLYLSQIKRFNMPVHTGIGNHESFGVNNPSIPTDNPFYGKKMYESKIGKRYYTFNHKGWKFLMIDDVKNTDTGSRYIGKIDEEQMEWLKKELAATDSATPIVICSHIAFISSFKKFELGSLSGTPNGDGISNSVEFFNLFAHHNLKLVLQGHFHFLEVLYANDIYYITGPSLTARWGNEFTKKSGLMLFTTIGNQLTWKFVENKL
jgi:Icc protein